MRLSERKKLMVNINGQEYTVVSVEDEDYIKEIARFVDKSIKEIVNNNSKLSNTMAAVLAAFNIADKYYKKTSELLDFKENSQSQEEVDELKAELERNKIKIETIKEESENKIKSLIEENENKLEALREKEGEKLKALEEEIKENKDELLSAKKEIEQLTKKNKQFESAIQIKDDDLASNQNIINNLQDKILEHQLEIVRMKKELEESLKLMDK